MSRVCFPDGGELFLSAMSQSRKGKLMADGGLSAFHPAPSAFTDVACPFLWFLACGP